MRLTGILFLIVISTNVFSQDQSVTRYYPSDKILQKNKVSKLFATSSLFHNINYEDEYDTIGRPIKYSSNNGNLLRIVEYQKVNDTLIESNYSLEKTKNKKLYAIQKYVYNNNGLITFYIGFRNWHKENPFTRTNIEKIRYNPFGKIESIDFYEAKNYPYKLDYNIPIVDTFFKLIEYNYYFYNSSNLLDHIDKILLPKTINESIYRLSYEYTDSSIIERSWALKLNGELNDSVESYGAIETVKSENGLIKCHYSLFNEKRSLLWSYEYKYW